MVQNHYRCRCLPLPYFSHCYDECDTSSSRRLHKQSVSNIAEYCCNIAKRVSCKEFGKKLAQDYPQDCCCKNLVKKNACSCKATSNILRKKVAQESCSWKAGLRKRKAKIFFHLFCFREAVFNGANLLITFPSI